MRNRARCNIDMCFNYLAADHALPQSDQIRLAPGALAPRRDLAQILVKFELRQLTVEKLPDVPR